MQHSRVCVEVSVGGSDRKPLSEKEHKAGRDLYWAAKKGDAAAVSSLLAAGANIEWGHDTNNGKTPLHAASVLGDVETIAVLIKAGSSVNALCHNGKSAIARAAEEGHAAAVQALLSAGADPVRGIAALDCATRSLESAQRSLDNKRKINSPAVGTYEATVKRYEQVIHALADQALPLPGPPQSVGVSVVMDGMKAMYDYWVNTPPHCRDREESGVIRPRAAVTIVGLKSRSDLNGSEALVGSAYSTAKGRWPVTLVEGGKCMLVESENLRVAAQQPADVPTAQDWLAANVPPGMTFMPKMPPIPMAGMPKPPTDEELRVLRREAALAMEIYASTRSRSLTPSTQLVSASSPAESKHTKVLPLAAGRFHTIWMAPDGTLRSCGSGDFDACTGGEQDEESGDFLPSEELRSFCMPPHKSCLPPGECHFVGHLGMGKLEAEAPVREPQIVRVVSSAPTILSLAAGALHSLALDASGTVWSWGWGGNGRLGLGDREHRAQPCAITGVRGLPALPEIEQISCGTEHSLLLSHDGQLLAFGRDHQGQLGLGGPMDEEDGDWSPEARVYPSGADLDDALLPTIISWYCPDGPKQRRSTMVTMMGLPSEMLTERIAADGVRFKRVAAGGEHSVALSSDGIVFAWGCPWEGRLGRPPPWQAVALPTMVPLPTKCVEVAAGKFCSLAATAAGQVYAWGDCGTGLDGARHTPTRVTSLDPAMLKSPIVRLYAGSEAESSIVLTESGRAYRLLKRVEPIAIDEMVLTATVGEGHQVLRLACGRLHGIGEGAKGQLLLISESSDASQVNSPPSTPMAAAKRSLLNGARKIGNLFGSFLLPKPTATEASTSSAMVAAATATAAAVPEKAATPLVQTPKTAAMERRREPLVTALDGLGPEEAEVDRILQEALSLGLMSEVRIDALTDALARCEVTAASLVDTWGKATRAELKLVRSHAAQKYLYQLARASEPVLGRNGRTTGRTIGTEAPAVLSDCMINRTGAYLGQTNCIQLLSAAQVRAAAAAEFRGVTDLMVLKWSVAYLKESEVEIRYEVLEGSPSASDKFPCVYQGQRTRPELDYTCLVAAFHVDLGSDGKHIFPPRTFRDEREEDADWDP